MLVFDRVGFGFGPDLILNDLSVELEPAEVLALRGANGAGKSTLLRLAAGLLEPTSGSIERSAAVRWVPQRSLTLPQMSVGDFFRFAGAVYDNISVSLLREIAAEFGLESLMGAEIASLSGGQRRRVQLSVAFASTQPAVLVLDEPSAPLDDLGRSMVDKQMRRVVERGWSILLASHSPAEIEAADRVLALAVGGGWETLS